MAPSPSHRWLIELTKSWRPRKAGSSPDHPVSSLEGEVSTDRKRSGQDRTGRQV